MSAYYIGDLVHVATTVVPRGSNTPTDTTMAVAVTKPDGSAGITPTISHDGSGLYSVDVAVDTAGYWQVTWTGSGAVVLADTVQFYVQSPGLKIVSLVEARDFVNKSQTYTGDDETLKLFIDTAGGLLESMAGAIVPRTVSEYHSGTAKQLFPRLWPVISITSVTETWPGGPIYTLNQMASLASSGTGYDFTFNPVDGSITRRVQRWDYAFPPGVDNITITYVAGRPQPWPAKYRLAALAEIAWLWRMFASGRGAGRPNLQQEETVNVPGFGAVPVAVVQLIGADRPPMAGA